jgi:predicted HAD superfamily phosphohydrolase YqeG
MLDKDKLLNLENKTVFLDIDGTIVFDGQKDVDPEDVLFVKKLQEKNKIAVVSNGNIDRNDYIANILGVLCIKNSIKKPNKDSVGDCLFDTNKVVVGDKYFTDGILALNIGAEFIKVKRLYSGRERLVVKLAYLYDFLFGYIFYKIYPFIKIMRINHWIKNFIIFSPLFFASNIFNFELLHKLILSFLSFSFLASAVYIFNDICDIKN